MGGRFINVRKLAAFDVHFRGARLIVVEFAFGVFGIGALGVVGVVFGLSRSVFAVGIGVYLLFLSVDYLPLLVYSVSIARAASAKDEIREELADFQHSRTKYGVQQMLLLVPLFIPALAVSQKIDKSRAT